MSVLSRLLLFARGMFGMNIYCRQFHVPFGVTARFEYINSMENTLKSVISNRLSVIANIKPSAIQREPEGTGDLGN